MEKLGIGPEVNFVVNPFVIQDLYIITTDLSNTKSNETFTTAVNIKAQKDIEKLINDKDVILEFTKFELINRIFELSYIHRSCQTY